MSDDGKLHYEAWCEADVRGYGPPWESIPPLLRALHDRVAALFIKRVGAERDAAIAERDRLQVLLEERARAGAGVAFDLKELRDEVDRLLAERDRLRRELETLRDDVCVCFAEADQRAIDAAHGPMSPVYSRYAGRSDALREVLSRLDAILRGES